MPTDTFKNLPEEKRARILDVAITEFAAHPYEAASISNIVRQAGIAKGSFYQYFADKQELYRYLIELGTEERLALLKNLPTPDYASDLFGYLRWLFLTAVHFEVRYPRLARISYRAFMEEDPFPEIIEELRRRGTTQFFKQLLSQGVLYGSISPMVDPDIGAFLLEAVYYRVGKYILERVNAKEGDMSPESVLEDESVQQILDNMMDLIKGGMQAQAS